MKSILLPFVLPLLVAGAPRTPTQGPESDAERAELEAKFEQLMTGCKMVGHFTVTGSDKPPQEEAYTIARVQKVRGDRWRFDATIEYGGKSVTVPLVVPVRWAGDTPVIQVTDMSIPMLGTYTARVVVYRDWYAGMWSGGDHGGHMYGRIVRAERPADQPDKQGGGAAWASWRGPDGTGVARDGNPPVRWSEKENVRWKVAIPGLGSSSPVVWRDRIYVTTAIGTGEQGEAAAEPPAERAEEGDGGRRGGRGRRGRGGRGFGRSAPPTEMHEFAVLALDRKDGRVVWQTTVNRAVPHEAGHPTASQASASPVTDGEHVFAHFGSRGLYCLDMDGEVKWSVDLGVMRTRNQFGEGASPALHGDTLVLTWDHEGDSYIVALDKRTGEELWRRDRDEPTSWSTPVFAPVRDAVQVVTAATRASRAYDLATGDLVWSLEGMTANCIPTPIHRDGVVYLMSGFRGNNLQVVRLQDASGDISDSDRVQWSHRRGTSYVPSALLYGDFLYFLRSNSGVLSCLDARTGEAHYEGQRLPGVRTVYSSPVGAAGRVYVTGREGATVVLAVGPEYEELATNQLDDGFDASAAIVGDELLLRGRQHLYCIAEQK